jgi:hypothetical protein
MRLRWSRYTYTGHPREEWHLRRRIIVEGSRWRKKHLSTSLGLGYLKRYTMQGPWHAVVFGKGEPSAGRLLGHFRRRCDGKRAIETALAWFPGLLSWETE